MHHQIFKKGQWRRCKTMKHPEVGLKFRPEINCSKSIDVMGVADTGAQSDLWSLDQFLKAWLSEERYVTGVAQPRRSEPFTDQNLWCLHCYFGRPINDRVESQVSYYGIRHSGCKASIPVVQYDVRARGPQP